MKKLIACAGIGVLLLSACSGNKEKIDQDSLKIAQLSQEYQEATSFNDSLLLLMGDIYTGLDSINQQEGLLYNNGNGDNVDRRAEIRENLANIKARLNANRKLLDQLEQKAKDSGKENSVLQKTIAQLKDRIASQDQKIAELTSQLNEAQAKISDLNSQVEAGNEALAAANEATDEARAQTVAADNEANKVYYAIGSNKELKQNGLLEKKFLGATKVMQGNDINTAYFTTADKRNLQQIPTNGRKIKVWSNMPEGSYQIVGGKDENKTLRITNPTQFWSRTPYLIIQVD